MFGSSAFAMDISHLKVENILVLEIENPKADGTKVRGKVAIYMRPDLAPNHVKRIKELVKKKFYDGHIFHRVIYDFMAQTGDPKGTGLGGSGKNLKAEFTRAPHLRGTVSMARADGDNDSADSQFFICLNRATPLDLKYTVWGRVVAGMDNVDNIPMGVPARIPGKMISARLASDMPNWKVLAKNFK